MTATVRLNVDVRGRFENRYASSRARNRFVTWMMGKCDCNCLVEFSKCEVSCWSLLFDRVEIPVVFEALALSELRGFQSVTLVTWLR